MTAKLPTHWQQDEAVQFYAILTSCFTRIQPVIHECYKRMFYKWKAVDQALKNIENRAKQRTQIIDILRNSNRGRRTIIEKEALKRFIVSDMKCIPSKEFSSGEMDRLCNEVDWFPCIGKSILFLQGDFGNCYYMIASGTIALYLEDSKDKEMVNGREFGKLRGQPMGPDVDISKLGRHLVNLSAGAGFGEFAILSTTQKIRSATAVAISDDCLLLILQASTYDSCLRKFHYRQRALSIAIKLLQELPLFNFAGFTKVSQLAYAMRNVPVSINSAVAAANSPIKHVFLIAKGSVKVFAAPHLTAAPGSVSAAIERRIPSLCICTLGRGKVIGFSEVRKGSAVFEMNYVADSSDCELFEIPITAYVNYIRSPVLQTSSFYKQLERHSQQSEASHSERVTRVSSMMKTMMKCTVPKFNPDTDLIHILPAMIEDTGFRSGYSKLDGSLSIIQPKATPPPSQAMRYNYSTSSTTTATATAAAGSISAFASASVAAAPSSSSSSVSSSSHHAVRPPELPMPSASHSKPPRHNSFRGQTPSQK